MGAVSALMSYSAATRSTEYTTDCLIGHAVITRDATERFTLLNPTGARLPIARVGSSSVNQVQLEGGQGETLLWDRQGQK